ncbi:MAG: glycosyltransferase, partial [Aquificota bacterium]
MKIGELFVKEGLITQEQLSEALDYQKRFGGRLGWILTTLGYVNRLDFFRTLAKNYNLPFFEDIDEVKRHIDTKLIEKFDPKELAEHEVLPAKLEEEVLVFTSNPNSQRLEEFIKKHFPNERVKQVIITDLDLIKLLEFYFKDRFIDTAVHGLFYISPEYSASRVFSKGQVLALAIFIYGSLVWLYYDAVSYFIALMVLVQIFYVVSILFKLVVSLAGAKSEMEQYISDEEVKSLDEKDLPVYTVLVPVYKEPEVIGILINSLKKMDYPQNKLDVILLLEEDDKETLQAAKAHRPPSNWRFIIVPNSLPKTKPKACNYGLLFARGKYLTIYDAEDVPEPDQLKKAVLAFKKGGDEYICFQAALNYFNKDENFLTKMFTL